MHYEPLIGLSWTLPMVLVTFIILFLILKKFFFEKVHNFMVAREDKIKDAFDNADASNRMADARLVEYNNKLAEVNAEKHEILLQSKQKADEHAHEIIDAAEKKASAIIARAEKEIQLSQKRAIEEMREQISLISIFAAEKIIEQNLNEKDQQHIIDGVINQVGKEEWKI